LKLEIHARTDVGLLRPRNEDAFSIWTPASSVTDPVARAVVAVADGMGGHPGGEIASSIAVEVASEIAASHQNELPAHLLQALFRRAADAIERRGQADPEYREMGTTLTTAFLLNGRAHVGHIGDSRMYWIRGGVYTQVTRDHNVAQELVLSGRLDAEVAEDHPMANVLTRCLGVCPDNAPDFLDGALLLEPGDVLLFASDGLAKAVHPQTLVELIRAVSAERATQQLVEAALSGGAPDNVTVVIVRVLESSGAPGASAPSEPDYRFGSSDSFSWNRGS
jgi:protein phosphatase